MDNWFKKVVNNNTTVDIIKSASIEDEIMMQGPLVDNVIQTVQMMFDLGAPTVFDDQGFNKGHFSSPIIQSVASTPLGSPLSLKIMGAVTSALMVYSRTQLPQAVQIRQQFEEEAKLLIEQYRQQHGMQQQVQTTDDRNAQGEFVVQIVGREKYGKVRVYVPEYETRIKGTRVVNQWLERTADDLDWDIEMNDWGKPNYFKVFQVDKYQPNNILVRPEFFPALIGMLEEYNSTAAKRCKARKMDCVLYDLSQIKNAVGNNDAQEDTQQNAPQPNVNLKPKVKVISSEIDSITVQFDYDAEAINRLKSLLHWKNRKPDKTDQGWTWTIKDLANRQEYVEKAQQIWPESDWDLSEYLLAAQNIADQAAQQPASQPVAGLMPLEVINVSAGGRHHMGFSFPRDKEKSKQLSYMIKFSFPAYGEMREIDKSKARWTYNVKGTYSDYVSFAEIMKKEGWDVGQYRQVFKQLLDNGQIQPEHVDGRLDGFTPDSPEVIEAFNKKVDSLLQSDFTPYDKQYDGIRHMYSRKSAFLGDETGAGKTLQSIMAAKLRAMDTNGRVLIITLKTTHIQWQKEIHKFLGEQETVGTHPDEQTAWTVVYYNQFSTPKTRDQLVESIKSGGYSVLILDESHCVKNKSIRSENILSIADLIPYKWGLTATLVANKATDAHRQLKAIGHRLGNLSEGQFKKEFGGYVLADTYVGKAYQEGDEQDKKEAAERLREWLARSGVYIRRTKRDMNPDLPNITIEDLPVTLPKSSMDKLNQAINDRMDQYKDPDMAVSQMIAERTELATSKVPYTLEMAENVISQGKKVLIFTCFIDSAKKLHAGLEKISKKEGKEVLTIVGGDKERQQKVERFKTDPNVSALVLSTIVGGTGLDLPNVVDDVVMNDFSWTPKDAEQSEGRAFRVTSTNDVDTKYMIANGTADEVFYNNVRLKIEIAKIIQEIDKDFAEAVQNGADVETLKKKRRAAEQQMLEADKQLIEDIQKLNKK